MLRNCIQSIDKLGFPFKTADPFLFCVYHKDLYPPSSENLKRGNGADFNPNAPYRMYHGDNLPGFPQHPHRGFETVTATMQGTIDHTDSLGSAGRYGDGDLQWMTAGAGVVHGEMFPMIHKDKPNTCRFFQIWLNLPRLNKMVPPSYVMHWNEEIPRITSDDGLSTITLWAGTVGDASGLPPPQFSWANQKSSELAIWLLTLRPGGTYTIPPAPGGKEINRTLYWIEGDHLSVGDQSIQSHSALTLLADQNCVVTNSPTSTTATELLLLQGRPIGEPVVQHGPFVMNTDAEIQQAFSDYRRTQFGGWPWPEDAMSFPTTKGRFTLQGGKEEHPPSRDQ